MATNRNELHKQVRELWNLARSDFRTKFGQVWDLNEAMMNMEHAGPNPELMKQAQEAAAKLGLELKFEVEKIDFDDSKNDNIEPFWEPSSQIC